MILALQFDLFYTIIEIPDRFKNLFHIENEFREWVYNCDSCREYFDDDNYVVMFDDDTFIMWFKEHKLEENENVRLIRSKVLGKTRGNNIDCVLEF